MIRVLKYTLHEHGASIIPLPRGSVLLHIGDQQGALQLWAQVNDQAPLESRKFATIYTGFDEVPHGRYVGTAISQGGNVVRHVFEILAEGDKP